MKLFFTHFLFFFFSYSSQAQSVANNYNNASNRTKHSISKVNLNGQWRGSFSENSGSQSSLLDPSSTTYVLELEINGNVVSGYSYTYFTDIGPKRYYTICRLTGSVDRVSNNIVVTEIERVKYNTPPYILNCFQVHRLSYEKGEGNTEYLKGEWHPAPNQDCGGKGVTVLSRQTLSRTPFAIKVPPKQEGVAKANPPATTRRQPAKPAPKTPVQETRPAPKTKAITSDIPVDKKTEPVIAENKPILSMPPAPAYKGYEKRRSEVAKTIQIESPVFQVDFYDNGMIDGDTISVFFNGKLIAANKMLTDKPLTLTLSFDKNYRQNVITMYAENLGSIPPNTAVMIVRDGSKRYEVRMESDLGKSGSVVFTHDD